MPVRPRGAGFQADVRVLGKRLRRDFDTKAAALDWIKSQKKPSLPSRPDAKVTITLSDLAEAVYERVWRDQKDGENSKSVADDVVSIMGRDVDIRTVETADVDNLITQLELRGISNATVNRKLAALSKMMRFAHARSWIDRLPHLQRKRESSGRVRWFDAVEEAEVLTWFKTHGYHDIADLVKFLIDTGFRLSEGQNIRWADVRDGNVAVTAIDTKNGSSRSVPSTRAVRALLAWRRRKVGHCLRVFPGLTRHVVENAWVKMRKQLGRAEDKQFVMHALRHTFCSRLIQRGASLIDVQQLAGHKSLTMTQRYAHLGTDHLRHAMDRLEGADKVRPVGLAVKEKEGRSRGGHVSHIHIAAG